jgi:uncharacterized membrane protein
MEVLFPFVLGVVVAIIGGALMLKAIKLQHPQRLYALMAIVGVSMLPRVYFDFAGGLKEATIGDVMYSMGWMLIMCVGLLIALHRRSSAKR